MVPFESPRSIIGTYLGTSVLFTLATSIIWAVNTLFLLHAGLALFQVFLVNAAFSAGDLVFQVPTGVIADTLGRKVSFLLSLATLSISTLVYLGAAQYHWGVWAFAGASVFIGLGFTFYSGAVEAWLVDSLNRVGYTGTREQVFAWGGMSFSAAMLVGTLTGGLLGQIDLALPYIVRAVMLALTFVVALVFMHETRAEAPPVTAAAFAQRSREVFVTGSMYGWRNPVVRPLLLASAVAGLFFIYGAYSWQRYFLDLLGTEAIWLVGGVSAVFAAAGILGNALVSRVTANGTREPTRIIAVITAIQAVLISSIGIVGLLTPKSSRGWAPFVIVVTLYMVYGLLFGLGRPIRQAFLNPHIPSAQRATVLSVDTMCSDGGGIVGQVAFGGISQLASIPLAWTMAGGVFVLGYPLYRRAGRAVAEEETQKGTDAS